MERNKIFDYIKTLGKVHIDTLDNPGWTIHIIENQKTDVLEPASYDFGNDWLMYSGKDGKLSGAGDEFKLIKILNVFRNWTYDLGNEYIYSELLRWFEQWYHVNCDGDWEHGNICLELR